MLGKTREHMARASHDLQSIDRFRSPKDEDQSLENIASKNDKKKSAVLRMWQCHILYWIQMGFFQPNEPETSTNPDVSHPMWTKITLCQQNIQSFTPRMHASLADAAEPSSAFFNWKSSKERKDSADLLEKVVHEGSLIKHWLFHWDVGTCWHCVGIHLEGIDSLCVCFESDLLLRLSLWSSQVMGAKTFSLWEAGKEPADLPRGFCTLWHHWVALRLVLQLIEMRILSNIGIHPFLGTPWRTQPKNLAKSEGLVAGIEVIRNIVCRI